MIVVLKQNPNRHQLESLIAWLQEKGIIIHTSIGEAHTILGLVGDTSQLDIDLIAALDIVEDVKRVQEPYKNANRKFHPEDTVVQVGNTQIGGGNLTLMAGPCSVESRGAGGGHCQSGEGQRRHHAAGGRLQAPDLPLLLPGPGGHGFGVPEGGPAGDRPPHRDGADGPEPAAPLQGCGRDPDRRPEHAELRPT